MNQAQEKAKKDHEKIMARVRENITKYNNLSEEGKREMVKDILKHYPENHVEKVKYERY